MNLKVGKMLFMWSLKKQLENIFFFNIPNVYYLDQWNRWYFWHPMTGVHTGHQLIPDLELPASDLFRLRQVLSLNVSSLPLKWVWQFTSLKTSHTNMSIDSIIHFFFYVSPQRKKWIILLWELTSWVKKKKRNTRHTSQGLLCKTRREKRPSSWNFYYLEKTCIVKRKCRKRINPSAWSHNWLGKHYRLKLKATQRFPFSFFQKSPVWPSLLPPSPLNFTSWQEAPLTHTPTPLTFFSFNTTHPLGRPPLAA